MFTKRDYIDYFSEIGVAELHMVFRTYSILQQVSDAAVRVKIERVYRDELRHYTDVRDKLMKSFLQDSEEKRRFEREVALGMARLRNPVSGKEFEVRCADISDGGIGIESEKMLYDRGPFEVVIDLNDGSGKIVRKGRLTWIKKVGADMHLGFIGGLTYDANPESRD